MKELLHAKDESRKNELTNPEHEKVEPLPFQWQQTVAKPMREGDLEGMKMNGVIAAQLNMLNLAHNSDNETVRYNATAFLLSQSGHGPMSRVEHTIDYKKMPADQLKSIILAKVTSIARRNPNFSIQSLLEGSKELSIETEFEVTEEESPSFEAEEFDDGP